MKFHKMKNTMIRCYDILHFFYFVSQHDTTISR